MPFTAKNHCFAAFSALMQSADDLVTSASPSRTHGPSQQVLRYKASAIGSLRQELGSSDTADDAELMSILLLAILEGRLRNTSQRDMHRKALGKLIELRGGLNEIDSCVKLWTLQFEALWTMETGTSFIKSQRNKSHGSHPIATVAPKTIAKLPAGFRKLVKVSKLSPKVVNALVRTNELLENGSKPASSGGLRRGSNPPQDDLWDTVAHLSRSSQTEPTIDVLLCLGLLLFNYVAMSSLPPWHTMTLWTSMGHWVRKQLTQNLLRCNTSRRVAEERCLLWLARVAVGSWQIGPEQLSIEGEMLATFGKSRFVEPFKDFRGSPADFFHNDGLCFDIASFGSA